MRDVTSRATAFFRGFGRGAMRLIGAALVVAMGLALLSVFMRSGVRDRPIQFDPVAAAEAKKARAATFDPNAHPTSYRNIHIEPRGESPVFAEMENEGKLPPLKERLPADPVVMEGPEGIGKYGGTWRRLAGSDIEAENIISWRLSGPYLVRWSALGYPIEPHIAKSVTPSSDKRAWTIELRPGLRWSDGFPYTADDIMYWWNDEANNPIVGVVPNWMQIGGKNATVEKLDQWHVRVTYPEPFPFFLEQLATHAWPSNAPEHYLRQYHPDPKIGDAKVIAREMAAYGMSSPLALYTFLKQPRNPEYPRMWPWIYKSFRSTPPQVLVRNPYYFAIDPAGNQLPYIDRVQVEVVDPQMLPVQAANGDATMQDRGVTFKDYTELMSRRDIAGTRVLHWYPATRAEWMIHPNMNRRIDPADPATKWKAELLADKRFRQALSVAIDREKIIRADSNGVGEPSQVSPGPQSDFANEDLAKKYAQHDPGMANRLLDELKLTRRDSDGYRSFPDGTKMTLFLDTSPFTGVGPAQFVVDDWGAVGLRVIYRSLSRTLFYAEKDAMNFDLAVWSSESDYMPLLSPRCFVATTTDSFYAVAWGRWFAHGGMYGSAAANAPGMYPPPADHPMMQAMRLYEQMLRATTREEQKKLFRRINEISAENVWCIGISTAPPALAVVSKDLRNVPEHALQGTLYSTPANTGMETWYFEHAETSPSTAAEMKRALTSASTLPGGLAHPGGSDRFPRIAKMIIGWALLAVLAAAGVRYPFVGRRLLLMIPTLAIISIVVFTIIHLPQGDFLSQRIMQLQSSGDESELRKIEDLRSLFHLEEPAWERYCRWVGLRWFVSYKSADEGLLQGNLGRSMETLEPVNDMVGDRILLTVLLSLGTILFTWVVAIPIGIYSAVRKYTLSDYVLTLIGFVGMSVPAFLLALVLMTLAGVSGLYSPRFAVQVGWDWPKVVDLLKHFWIPVVVLGAGGTAGLIRVMRANLLDELRKPYVTTARAKGVGPLKLLMKYPVRVALNPLMSGISSLFPQLVSGGAIVSIVLSLPMIGPLLLSALLSQDMYLAGSLLMVLAVLSVAGTLVSDLLLLWLDPRIRFEGGTR
jgi:ABC-type dipeptide/oligopeptide/nickel transport system permease component/ABC-type transport system substrate-binding protein